MSVSMKKIVASSLAGVTLCAGLVAAVPADAQGYGYRDGRRGPVYVQRHYRGPVYVQRHRRDAGAAVAAGVVGGLALGALAATAARPAYGGPYLAPVQDYAPAPYAYEAPIEERRCYTVRRKFVDEFGDETISRRRVCD
jgi:hypothetical protein